MGMLERSVTGWPLVPFSIGGPQKGIAEDSEQRVDRKALSLCPHPCFRTQTLAGSQDSFP